MDRIVKYFTDNFDQPFVNGMKKDVAGLINALSREEIGELRYRLFNEARRLEVTKGGQQSLFWLQNCFDLIGEYKFSMHKVYFSPGTDILE